MPQMRLLFITPLILTLKKNPINTHSEKGCKTAQNMKFFIGKSISR